MDKTSIKQVSKPVFGAKRKFADPCQKRKRCWMQIRHHKRRLPSDRTVMRILSGTLKLVE